MISATHANGRVSPEMQTRAKEHFATFHMLRLSNSLMQGACGEIQCCPDTVLRVGHTDMTRKAGKAKK